MQRTAFLLLHCQIDRRIPFVYVEISTADLRKPWSYCMNRLIMKMNMCQSTPIGMTENREINKILVCPDIVGNVI